LGPAKLVLADHALPGWDELVASIGAARAAGRAVAVHSVTRESLLLVLAVLAEVGVVVGDRIEHAAVAPAEAIVQLARLGVAVVTQPSLVARRGEQYRDRVDAKDRPWLWPYGSLLSAGIAVSPSSDAPYGDLDPWAGIRAARDRTTSVGRTLGSGERVEAATALRGYLASSPGQRPREVAVGEPADLVLLDAPLPEVLADPAAERVRATLIGGRVRHG
jgi:predicted amidohydrolase YtcJ